jgi:uncharacterized Tic20 family protein
MKTTNTNILSMLIGILLIIYGLFQTFSFNQRDIFIGIAFIFYGIGTMLTATQKPTIVKVGIVINFVTLIVSIAAALYEKFIS